MSVKEYLKLCDSALPHLKTILTVAYNTGMRSGELRGLKWSFVDRDKGFIRLPTEVTKERKPKVIPMNHYVKTALAALPRNLHHDFVVDL